MTGRYGVRWHAAAAALLAFAAGARFTPDGRAADLGRSRETAIEVCGPSGEHGYFDRLKCPDGSLVKYELVGLQGRRNDAASKAEQEAARTQMLTSVPIPSGQRDFHMLDGWSVECSAGPIVFYVDRYHCPEPKHQESPPGFAFLDDQAPGPAPAIPGERGPGLAKESAVEVCGPQGARDYLDRLRCADGSVVAYQRTGSMGARHDPTTNAEIAMMQAQFATAGPIPTGQPDFHVIDGYNAECRAQKRFLYLDPYHCPDPKNQAPPPGFSLTSGRKTK